MNKLLAALITSLFFSPRRAAHLRAVQAVKAGSATMLSFHETYGFDEPEVLDFIEVSPL